MVKGVVRLSGSISMNPLSLSSAYKQINPVLIKLVASVLLLGLAFHLFSSHSFMYSSPSSSPSSSVVVADTYAAAAIGLSPAAAPDNGEAKCDMYIGDWIPKTSGPGYTNKSCHFIQDHQNCMKNGRPDSEYLYWRWSPRDCELPGFDPQRFLDLMQNKSLAFIGDSISRNHVQSLLCILSQVEKTKEIYRDEADKSKTWYFSSHNFTVAVIWTPFLVKADIFEDNNGFSESEIKLYLDVVDETWSSRYKNFDYMIISAGKWFLKTAIYYEKDQVQGCHYCTRRNLTELGFEFAYHKALQMTFKFITSTNHKAVVFFRTTSPDHFENGEWFSGGTCNRTLPFKDGDGDGETNIKDVDRVLHEIELQEYEKAATAATTTATATANGVTLKLIDITRLSLLRPDGHPGPFRIFNPFATEKNANVQNDCLHWCLPGPIDSWNDLVLEMLVHT